MFLQNSSPIAVFIGVFIFLLSLPQFSPAFAGNLPQKPHHYNFFNNASDQNSDELKPNEARERDLKSGAAAHFYAFTADAGNCLRFVVEQKKIDVIVEIQTAAGERIKFVDRPSGGNGRETATFIAPKTGSYRIKIQSYDTTSPGGKYNISYTKIDSPTDIDKKRSLAENLTSEGELLRFEGKRETKLKSLEKFSAALTLWRELKDEYEQAVVFYAMAWTHQGLANYGDAAIYFGKALKIMRKLGDEYAQALNHYGLGTVEYILTEYHLSLYNNQQAVNIYRKLGYFKPLGAALAGLGAAQSLLEMREQAVETLTESLRWRDFANDKKGKAKTLVTLAKVYAEQKLYEKAEKTLAEAQKTLNEAGADGETQAEIYANLGWLYLATRKSQIAEEKFQAALPLAQAGGNRLGEANVLLGLSVSETRNENFSKALENIRAALKLVESLRQATDDFRIRANFAATLQNFYEQYILLLMKMNEREPEKRFDLEALEIVELTRARALLERLERRRLLRENKIAPALLELKQQLQEQFTNALAKPRKKTDSAENNQKLMAEIQDVSARYLENEAEINRFFPATDTTFLPTLNSAQIRQNLDADTILLEYALTDAESFLWLVSDQEVESYRLPTRAEIEAAAREFYDCVSRQTKTADEKMCREKNLKLSRILLSPAAKDLANKRIIIAAQGFLQYIPFAALSNPKSADRFLIETNEIVYLPSASLLSFLRKPNNPAAEKTLAIFADPIYSAEDARLKKRPPSKNSEIEETNKIFPRLFASRFEADRIAEMVVSAENVLKITDAQASRQTVLTLDLRNYRILHFAAHTFVDDRQPELSAVALSFYDGSGAKINGFLRSSDILRLDLNAEMVVLSACRTALGKQVKGEGMMSLAHSFFSAGAKRLVASLWDVDDKLTAEMMRRFYFKYLKEGKTASSALRATQIEILRDARWKNPFYWSAFTFQGDWR